MKLIRTFLVPVVFLFSASALAWPGYVVRVDRYPLESCLQFPTVNTDDFEYLVYPNDGEVQGFYDLFYKQVDQTLIVTTYDDGTNTQQTITQSQPLKDTFTIKLTLDTHNGDELKTAAKSNLEEQVRRFISLRQVYICKQ